MVLSYSLWFTSVWASFGYAGIGALAALSLIRAFVGGATLYAVLMRTGIPTAVAALCWRHLSRSASFLTWPVLYLPLTAAALFVAKVGLTADALYAGYWVLVPVLYAALPLHLRTHIVVRSLVCSFAAHAVGSLIILYAGFTLPWFALVPVVLFERLVATAGIASISFLYQAFCVRMQRSVALERY